MRALIVGLLILVLAGCTKPEPVWTETILAGPDQAPDACDSNIEIEVPKAGEIRAKAAAQWQAHTIDKFAELRKDRDICAAWAKRQRPKK